MSFLPGLSTFWADLQKIFAFAPVIAALDPNAAGGIAVASAAVAALQPTVQAVVAASSSPQTHEQIVAAVTSAVTAGSTELVKLGVMSATTDQHVQAVAPLINAAVAASGLATPAVAPA